MSELELEQMIHGWIKDYYNAVYNGLLKVTKKSGEYIFTLGLPSETVTTTTSSNHESDEEFLKYVYSELKARNYMRTYFYKIIKKHDVEQERRGSCKCD